MSHYLDMIRRNNDADRNSVWVGQTIDMDLFAGKTMQDLLTKLVDHFCEDPFEVLKPIESDRGYKVLVDTDCESQDYYVYIEELKL